MKKLLPAATVVSIALLILFRKDAMAAAQNGFILWRDFVLPVLLPYFILISIFMNKGAAVTSKAALFALSMFSGAPSAAKLCSYINSNDGNTKTDLTAMLNTVSPMFVYGSFCAVMLNLPMLAIPIILSQVMTAALMFTLYNSKMRLAVNMNNMSQKSGLSVFAESVATSISALLGICGTIIFFSVLMCILDNTGIIKAIALPFEWLVRIFGLNGKIVQPLIYGMLEITTGAAKLACADLSFSEFAFCGGFVFSFGGLCVLAQSAAFVDIDTKRYLLIKLIAALISGLLAFVISLIFDEPSMNVMAYNAQVLLKQNTLSFIIILATCALCQASVLLICLGYKRTRCTKRTSR